MTLEERVAQLESLVAKYEAFFRFVTNEFDGQTGVMTQGRFGVMTDFWMRRPAGQGAALSVGTVSDRFAIYGEADAAACPDAPTTAICGAVYAGNLSQRNVAFEAHARNSMIANIALHSDGHVEVGDVPELYVGKLSSFKRLWP